MCLRFSIGLFILKTNIPCFGLIYRLSPDLPLDSLINPACNPPNSAIQVSRIEGCSKPRTVILLACSLQRGMLAHRHVTVVLHAVKIVAVVFSQTCWVLAIIICTCIVNYVKSGQPWERSERLNCNRRTSMTYTYKILCRTS